MTASAMRAVVRRDGPGEWSFIVGPGVTRDDTSAEQLSGLADTWDDAYRQAAGELEHLADVDRLRAAAALHARQIRGAVTPGDPIVPPGNRRYRRRWWHL